MWYLEVVPFSEGRMVSKWINIFLIEIYRHLAVDDVVGVGRVLGRSQRKMARSQYEPRARYEHSSFLIEGKVCVWGGNNHGDSLKRYTLPSRIECFDPYLEVWNQVNTAGTPHPGLYKAACVSFGERMYVYGGCIGSRKYVDILSCLDLNQLTWSHISAGTAGGPMKKESCGMVLFHGNKLAVIGGFGIPTGRIQPGSTFIRNTKFSDGSGWTNEIHVFSQSTHAACTTMLYAHIS